MAFRSYELPAVVPPKGLSADRQSYLYDSIRPFRDEDSDKDLTLVFRNQTADQVLLLDQHPLETTNHLPKEDVYVGYVRKKGTIVQTRSLNFN